MLPTKYQVIKLRIGTEFVGMVREMPEGVEVTLPMCYQLTPINSTTTNCKFYPFAPTNKDVTIKLNEEDIMFRGTCAEQYIPAYDKASSQWMSMLENGTIPLSLFNDATGVVRDEYSFQDDEDEFLDELSDEEIRLMMKDTPDIIH